jgi:hypothetical protein
MLSLWFCLNVWSLQRQITYIVKKPITLLHVIRNYIYIYEIWASHGGEDIDGCLLGCDAMLDLQMGTGVEDGGSIFLLNIGTHLQVHIVLHPRRLSLTEIIYPFILLNIYCIENIPNESCRPHWGLHFMFHTKFTITHFWGSR